MTTPKPIYIVGIPPLQCAGICAFLKETEYCNLLILPRMEDFLSLASGDESMIISLDVLLENMEYVLHRKKHVAVYIPGRVAPDVPEEPIRFGDDVTSQKMKDIAKSITETMHAQSSPSVASTELSIREKEVLSEIASGKSFKEIADILCISVNTVITHRKNISQKLGIRSVSGLSVYALMNGLI